MLLREYAWALWEQQDPQLKEAFPVLRPKDRQAVDRLEFKQGGLMLALPGKDPNKIRSEHPSRLIMEEAAFIDSDYRLVGMTYSSSNDESFILKGE